MRKLSRQYRADLMLVMVTFFWGTSYYLSDLCMTEMGPMTLNAFRFLSAFFILSIFFRKTMRKLNRKTLRYSLLVGLALTVTYIFYGYGLPLTSISNAGFLCCLTVLFTPILNLIFRHIVPERKFLPAMVLCVLGLAMLTLGDDFSLNMGDLLCLCVSICYAVDLLITERAVHDSEVDALGLGVCQLSVVGVITLIFAFLLEQPHLPQTPKVWAAALFLGVFCSGAAFAVQSVEQQYTTANHVGLIFTLEPVFATIVSFAAAGEKLSLRGYIGAALILVSLLIMEIDFFGLRKKREPESLTCS